MPGAQPPPDGDELRARHFLLRLHVRPFGHQDPAVSASNNPPPNPPGKPIIPTRVIPAGQPLPTPTPPPPPRRPPAPAPPAPAPPPPPAGSAPRAVVVRHIHEIVLIPPEEQPPGLCERLWDALFTWRMIVAVLAALLPWAGGDSPVGIWGHTVHQARTDAGLAAAYIIAGTALAAAWALDRRTGRFLPRFLLVTAALGGLGVLDWFDSITFLTGVHR